MEPTDITTSGIRMVKSSALLRFPIMEVKPDLTHVYPSCVETISLLLD
jgi:hypothetical protein